MEIVRDCFPSHSCGVVGFVRCTALDFSFSFYLSPCGDLTFDREPCLLISVFKSFAVFPSLGGV
jgi:hypothetical protein